jgi:hypothetical protein
LTGAELVLLLVVYLGTYLEADLVVGLELETGADETAVVGFTGADETELVVAAELVLLSDDTDLVETGLLTEEVFLVGR